MKRVIATVLVLAGAAGAACYQDDAVLHPPAIAPTNVYITDDPFPYDIVGGVSIYVTKIEANASPDSTKGSWVTIATPNKSFDLLTLQQGAKAFVGQGTIQAGQYQSIRMTIDVDRSSIKYADNSDAVVQWPAPGHGEITLQAFVENPLEVQATGADIVIDFDVGRSFQYYNYGAKYFVLLPSLRAVNSAATGAISGKVVVANPPSGTTGPVFVKNENITVFSGNPSQSLSAWNVISTARTDSGGVFVVGFVPPGSWNIQFTKSDDPTLKTIIITDVVVVAGDTTHQGVALPFAGGGGTFISVSGAPTVPTGGTITVHAVVYDSTEHPEPIPQVSWFSRDTGVALVLLDSTYISDSLSNTLVLGRSEGSTWIIAKSGALLDSLFVQVTAAPPPPPPSPGIASVIINPSSLDLAVGDSTGLTAVLRDSSGNVVTNGTVYWSIVNGQDSTVVVLYSYNRSALVRALRTGSTKVQAIEAIHLARGEATITVH